nr:unnamed protein product [Spirometra erinaceieuropaei]
MTPKTSLHQQIFFFFSFFFFSFFFFFSLFVFFFFFLLLLLPLLLLPRFPFPLLRPDDPGDPSSSLTWFHVQAPIGGRAFIKKFHTTNAQRITSQFSHAEASAKVFT